MTDRTLITHDHTVSGLIRNDIDALDWTLAFLGHAGNLDAQMPRQKRQVIFGQGELSRSLLRELRNADGPLTSRELAQNILALRGDDVRGRASYPKW